MPAHKNGLSSAVSCHRGNKNGERRQEAANRALLKQIYDEAANGNVQPLFYAMAPDFTAYENDSPVFLGHGGFRRPARQDLSGNAGTRAVRRSGVTDR